MYIKLLYLGYNLALRLEDIVIHANGRPRENGSSRIYVLMDIIIHAGKMYTRPELWRM